MKQGYRDLIPSSVYSPLLRPQRPDPRKSRSEPTIDKLFSACIVKHNPVVKKSLLCPEEWLGSAMCKAGPKQCLLSNHTGLEFHFESFTGLDGGHYDVLGLVPWRRVMGEHQMFSKISIMTKSKFTLDGDFPGIRSPRGAQPVLNRYVIEDFSPTRTHSPLGHHTPKSTLTHGAAVFSRLNSLGTPFLFIYLPYLCVS